MNESVPIYRYSPIDSNWHIRVLKLEPAISFADPLVGSFFTRKLDDVEDLGQPMPNYQGVSYCWGPQSDTNWMLCDGQRLSISTNVALMLRHFRKSGSPRNLWIDAICINQADWKEKAEQVRAMGTIYERADKVHVWLGPAVAEDQISSVFAVLKSYALISQSSAAKNIEALSSLAEPLNKFMQRAWFTRRWIIQEVKLAHAVTVHCGHQRISWNWFADGMANFLATHVTRSGSYLRKGLLSADAVRAVEGLSSLVGPRGKRQTIFQLLWHHHTSACADERDRIFALYGMMGMDLNGTSDDYPPTFFTLKLNPFEQCPVDYSSHFSLLYTRMAFAAIEGRLGRVIISHALAFGNLAQQHPPWPSWVPSWNLTRTTRHSISIGMPILHYLNNAHAFQLTGSFYPIVKVHDTVSPGGTIAFLRDTMHENFLSEIPVKHVEAVVDMLFTSFKACEDCYDCVGVQYEAIFSMKHHEGMAYQDNRFLLLSAFRRELGIPQNNSCPIYSPEALQQELDKMTQRHRLFRYQIGTNYVSGISFASVQAGDFVYRPCYGWGDSNFSAEYALVIRRHNPSPSLAHQNKKAFRLVGWCTPGWKDYNKPPEFPKHEQPDDVLLV
jgi:hypothetical protein